MKKIFLIIEGWGLKIMSLVLAIIFGSHITQTKTTGGALTVISICYFFSMLFVIFIKLDER